MVVAGEALLWVLLACVAQGQPVSTASAAAQRPQIGPFRWQEDWSVLGNAGVLREPGDALKYLRLSGDDAVPFLSFGTTLRERFEHRDAALLGSAADPSDDYLLHRLELHVDAHLTTRTRVFLQLENAAAFGRERRGPLDTNDADLRLAFLDTGARLWGGEALLRIGRQEVAFDLQRFASARDGANLRQAFDAAWLQYTRNDWLLSAFASEPVQYRNAEPFDDRGDRHFIFVGARAKRRLAGHHNLSVTVSTYRREGKASPPPHLRERRDNLDVHYSGAGRGFDWDLEGLVQRGTLGDKTVRAWGAGTLAGYTFAALPSRPRIGLQIDAASGDRDATDGRVETFNPLFPNGYYVTLSGFTGYVNFVHVKPSLTFQPSRSISVLIAAGMLWRATAADAVYVQPAVPIPNTAGRGGTRTAGYEQLRIEWAVTRNLAFAFEANAYQLASSIRAAGGHDSNYVSAEVRWAW